MAVQFKGQIRYVRSECNVRGPGEDVPVGCRLEATRVGNGEQDAVIDIVVRLARCGNLE